MDTSFVSASTSCSTSFADFTPVSTSRAPFRFAPRCTSTCPSFAARESGGKRRPVRSAPTVVQTSDATPKTPAAMASHAVTLSTHVVAATCAAVCVPSERSAPKAYLHRPSDTMSVNTTASTRILSASVGMYLGSGSTFGRVSTPALSASLSRVERSTSRRETLPRRREVSCLSERS